MRTVTVLALAAVLLAACADGGTAGEQAPPTPSGWMLTGTVTAAPGCPGPQRAGSGCPDRPVSGALVELASGDRVVASARTDADGRFQLAVPARGDYRVTATNAGGFPSQASRDVSITGPLDVTLTLDSGLR